MGDKLTRNDRIQINLAQITQNESDTFRVIRASNEIDFTCELCGQQHVSKVYTVLNINTELTIRIGCECVKHFRMQKSDLDKAESMLKRIEQAVRESKKDLIISQGKKLFDQLPEEERRTLYFKRSSKIEELGNKFFQDMPLAERSKFYYAAYMMHEAIRLYGGGNSGYDNLTHTYQKGTYIYSQEEIYAAVEKIGSRDIFEKKIAEIDTKKLKEEQVKLSLKIGHEIEECKKARKAIDIAVKANFIVESIKLSYEDKLNTMLEQFEIQLYEIKARDAKYPWLFEYTGNNSYITTIKNWLLHYDLSEDQIKKAQMEIEAEKSGKLPPDDKTMLETLVKEKPDNSFYQSVMKYYMSHGSISEKQRDHILIGYKAITKESAE